MARFICMCRRNVRPGLDFAGALEVLNARMFPDNIRPNPPIVHSREGLCFAVLNPSATVVANDFGVCLGKTFDEPCDWWKPKAGVPDGSFMMFRSDADTVELVTDIVASRTIWYVHTEDVFLAATSQRALVCLLEEFRPNPSAFAWMLSAGTLGPDNSWDCRIKRLGPDARLLLDRRSWTLAVAKSKVEFVPSHAPREDHLTRMKQVLSDVFERLRVECSQWDLMLSGGYDSRAILLMLRNRDCLRCITWGLASSVSDSLGDAYIARQLASHFHVQHKYLEMELSNEGFETIAGRYLIAGEGRVDHISGYTDGMRVWRMLHEEGKGVIRGDEAFGKYAVDNEFETRDVIALRCLSDCANLRGIDFELPAQVLPDYLQRKRGETLETWRDRMNQEYELPCVWGALNDVKCTYVELMNPLISRNIVHLVRTLPDALRTNKRLFVDLVRGLSPAIPFAQRAAIDRPFNILRTQEVVDLVRSTLDSSHARRLISRELLGYIMGNIQIAHGAARSRAPKKAGPLIKRLVPRPLKRIIKAVCQAPVLDVNVLAFRAYIIVKMCEMLGDDAASLRGMPR